MVPGQRSSVTKKTLHIITVSVLLIMAAAAAYALYRNGSSWLSSIQGHQWVLNIPRLTASAVILSVSLILTPAGWVMICRGMGSKIPSAELFAAWFSSQLGRYIPGKIWLFAGRAGFLKARGMNGARAAATTAYELFFTVASVGFVSVAVLFTTPDLLSGGTARTAALTAASFMILLPLLHPVQKLICRKRGIPVNTLPSAAEAIKISAFYALLWAARGLSIYLLLTGTGIVSAEPARSVAAAPLSWLAGYIVVFVPGGIGIREAAAAAIAAPAAVAPAALALAGQRIFMTVAEVLLALFTSKKIIPTREDKCR